MWEEDGFDTIAYTIYLSPAEYFYLENQQKENANFFA